MKILTESNPPCSSGFRSRLLDARVRLTPPAASLKGLGGRDDSGDVELDEGREDPKEKCINIAHGFVY